MPEPSSTKPPREDSERRDVRIDRIGQFGDAVAEIDGRSIHLPYAAPGDRVRLRLPPAGSQVGEIEIEAILAPGPDRATPVCRHFGDCGGCQLQHLSSQAYRRWKSGLVPLALAQHGLGDIQVRPMIEVPAGLRRRASFAAGKSRGRVLLGFHRRRGADIVDLAECHILLPEMARLLEPLRQQLAAVMAEGQTAELIFVQSDSGGDLAVSSAAPADAVARQSWAAFAEAHDLARVSWAVGSAAFEPLAFRRQPRAIFADIEAILPPACFLQPSLAGEAAMRAAIDEALGKKARRIADLFSGVGSFALPLARRAQIHAVEGDRQATEALLQSAKAAGLADRLTVERRDLERAPLQLDELRRFDAVLFDPPRAGAKAQCERLAKSKVERLAAASCNPISFARDAKLLIEGGYRLEWVQPIDQFPWSAHLELVAAFRRR